MCSAPVRENTPSTHHEKSKDEASEPRNMPHMLKTGLCDTGRNACVEQMFPHQDFPCKEATLEMAKGSHGHSLGKVEKWQRRFHYGRYTLKDFLAGCREKAESPSRRSAGVQPRSHFLHAAAEDPYVFLTKDQRFRECCN